MKFFKKIIPFLFWVLSCVPVMILVVIAVEFGVTLSQILYLGVLILLTIIFQYKLLLIWPLLSVIETYVVCLFTLNGLLLFQFLIWSVFYINILVFTYFFMEIEKTFDNMLKLAVLFNISTLASLIEINVFFGRGDLTIDLTQWHSLIGGMLILQIVVSVIYSKLVVNKSFK